MISIMNCVDLIARACYELSNVTCKVGRFNAHPVGSMSEEDCRLACNAEEKCEFFFWRIDKHCSMREWCGELVISQKPGIIYAKNGKCRGIISISPMRTLICIIHSFHFEMTITKLIHFLKLGGILISEKKCSDGIQNQGETGVDCGGLCEPCSKINKIIRK